MNPVITALYDSRSEADRALRFLAATVPAVDASVFDDSPAGYERLDRFNLSQDELAACKSKLAENGHLLLAQVGSARDLQRVITALESWSAEAPWQGNSAASGKEALGSPAVIREEHLPLVEEEIEVGTREIVRGGVKVRTRVEDVPRSLDIELLEEIVRADRRPSNRLVNDADLETAGLLRERVFEIAQYREEAVVTKEAFIREEVVVSKSVEYRTQQIHETLRHTEIEPENLGGGSTRREALNARE